MMAIVGQALADVLIDVVTLATMHTILGFTKKIYEWMLKLYANWRNWRKGKRQGIQLTTLGRGSWRPGTMQSSIVNSGRKSTGRSLTP